LKCSVAGRRLRLKVRLAVAVALVCLVARAGPAADAGVSRGDPAGGMGGRREAALEHLPERVALLLRKTGLSDVAVVFIISMMPILELRGAIPAGHVLDMNPWLAYAVAVVGNMVPIPFVLLFLGPLSEFCMRWRWGRIFFQWLFARTRRKTATVEKYETLGLTIFVAIPLPVTGAWTGSVAAFLLGLRFHHAMVSILLGVLIAGVIMTTLSLMGWLGALVAGLVLGGLAVSGIMGMFRREESRSGRGLPVGTD